MAIAYNSKIVTDGLVNCFDSGNPKSFSPNTFSKPTDLWGWVNSPSGNASTLSRDTINSPVGNTPLKMVVNGNDPHTPTYNTAAWNISSVSNGQTWVVSLYVKASVATAGEIYIFGADSSGVSFVGGSYIGITAKTINITTEWTRVDHFITFNNAAVAFIQVRLDGPDTGGAGRTIWWDGLQVELASSPSTFNPNTNSNRTSWRDIIRNDVLTIYGSVPYNAAGHFTLGNDQTSQYMMNTAFTIPTAAITFSCWFRSNFTGPVQTPFTYSVAGNNEMLFFINTATEIAPHDLGSAFPITVPNMQNRWCNFVWSRVSSTGVSVYYLDGVQVSTRTYLAGTSLTSGGYMIIGQESDLPGAGFDANQNLDGDFARLEIYNRALTATEVQQNYNAMRGRFGV